MLKKGVFPWAPRKSEPLFAEAEVNSHRICVKPTELPLTPMAAAAPEAYAVTVGISMARGWSRKATMTSNTSWPVILTLRYSGVLPDINPTTKTVIKTNITMYIIPTPFPPGID